MRLIAFITDGAQITKILDHIGIFSEPPLWDNSDAQTSDGVQIEPEWDLAAQAVTDHEVEQRITW